MQLPIKWNTHGYSRGWQCLGHILSPLNSLEEKVNFSNYKGPGIFTGHRSGHGESAEELMSCPPQSITSSIKTGTGKNYPRHPCTYSGITQRNILFAVPQSTHLSWASIVQKITSSLECCLSLLSHWKFLELPFQKKKKVTIKGLILWQSNLIYLLSLVLFLVGILIKPN